MSKQELFTTLVHNQILVTPALQKAFAKVDRGDFVRPEYQELAYEDHPLPIGFGQSISQPSTVAFMLELLAPKKSNVILDLGAGSGWTSCLLAEAVGPRGRVYTVEVIPELLQYAQSNIKRYGYNNITTLISSGRLGLPQYSPFERILVSAEAQDLPATLIDQLALGGTLVMPIQGAVVKIDKVADTMLETRTFPGFAFVPLQ